MRIATLQHYFPSPESMDLGSSQGESKERHFQEFPIKISGHITDFNKHRFIQ